jgi:hypothetical protein
MLAIRMAKTSWKVDGMAFAMGQDIDDAHRVVE